LINALKFLASLTASVKTYECEKLERGSDVQKGNKKGKGKGFPYSTPSVGPGADPGVQAVSPQVTVKSYTRR